MAFMGMGMNASGSMMGATQQNDQTPQSQFIQQQANQQTNQQDNEQVNQQTTESQAPEPTEAKKEEDPYDRLLKLKKLLDAGVISQEEFDKEKFKILEG